MNAAVQAYGAVPPESSPTARVGGVGLALFALSSVWQTAPANYGLGLALLAALAGLVRTRPLARDTATTLVLATAAWVLLRGALQSAGYGEATLVRPLDGMLDWLWALAFLPFATLPAADPIKRVRRLWLLSMLGFGFGVLSFLYVEGVAVLWSGQRLRFHLDRPLGMGLYAGCFLLALVTTWRQWWNHGGPWRWPLRIAGVAAVGLNLEVLITTQNRATYLALLVVTAAGAAAWIVSVCRGRRRLHWHRLAAGALVLSVVGAAITLNADTIRLRLGAEQHVVDVIHAEGLAAAPASSISVRLRLWQYVLDRFPDAPLLGHGFGGLQSVIDRDLRDRVPLLQGERYDHVHNSYLQTLWGQGLAGMLLWGALLTVLMRDVVHAARRVPRVRSLMPAVWSIAGFTAVWAVFDYRLSHPDMRCFVILLLLSLRLLAMERTPAPAR